ncbi:MAG: hypothetical protein H3C43_04950 [Leptonema sp. (in: Bacteria)]|nr:hypothetical protein [Leptonema sp. (in: bacteria)]
MSRSFKRTVSHWLGDDKKIEELNKTNSRLSDYAHWQMERDKRSRIVLRQLSMHMKRLTMMKAVLHRFREAQATQFESTQTEVQKAVQYTEKVAYTAKSTSAAISEVQIRVSDSITQFDSVSRLLKDHQKNLLQSIEKISQLSETFTKLEESVSAASSTIAVIREVNERLHLLSLNANIEAARAGQQGLGFAIVATEMEKLAEQTASQTKQTSSILASLLPALAATKKSHDLIIEESKASDSSFTTMAYSIKERIDAMQETSKLLNQMGQMGKETEQSVVLLQYFSEIVEKSLSNHQYFLNSLDQGLSLLNHTVHKDT